MWDPRASSPSIHAVITREDGRSQFCRLKTWNVSVKLRSDGSDYSHSVRPPTGHYRRAPHPFSKGGSSLLARLAAEFLCGLRGLRQPLHTAVEADKGARCGTGEQRIQIPMGAEDEEVGQGGEGTRQSIHGLLGEGFLERVEGRGKVVIEWVDQHAVLDHPAVGGFLSHAGWNSVTEAAVRGMKMLAWPCPGDHGICAMVMEKSGLGVWPSDWSWDGDDEVVAREEISRRLRELMNEDPAAAATTAKVKEEAPRAIADGGTSDRNLYKLVARFQRRRS